MGLRHCNDFKVLIIILMIFMISTKTLMNTIQIRGKKYWSHSLIWLLICLITKKYSHNLIVTELFSGGKQQSISLAFITKFYFAVPENVKAISRNYFIMKTSNIQELQQIAINNSLDIVFKDFMKLHKKFTAKPHSFFR